jgi:hypothetical protein
MRRRATVTAAAVLPSLALFVLHAAPLRHWIVDDAGISFAYARSFAAGHGLVAQPGAPRVEGFSNPLWTLLLALFYRLDVFDVTWTPKLVSLVLVGATLVVVAADLRRDRSSLWPPVLATTLIAASTAFVVWTTSGLENALLALLAALSCRLTARAAAGELRLAVAAGAMAALVALTRPDGALYVVALPLVLLSSPLEWRDGPRVLLRRLLAPLAGFAPLHLGYLLFRRAYFGEWVPNTYYAKDKPSLAFLFDRWKWSDLLSAALGPLGLLAAALLIAAAIAAARRGTFDARRRALAVHLGIAAGAYMLLPLDWMGEYRFATPFFLFFYWGLGEVLSALWESGLAAHRIAVTAAALACVAASACIHVPRTRDFATWPVVPFSIVGSYFGEGYNRVAEAVPVREPSLLAADVGGTYIYSRLRVYDLVGLCDRTTARTLTSDTAAFHRYVLEDVRPTFIHVHTPWAGWAAFQTSARFKTDYAAIRETWPRPGSRVALESPGAPQWADYVRRDALGPDPEAGLAAVRRAYTAAGLQTRDDL